MRHISIQMAFCLSLLLANLLGCGSSDDQSTSKSSTRKSGSGKSAQRQESSGSQKQSSSEQDQGDVEEGWGDLKVQFVYEGDVPPRAKLNITKNQDVCTKDHPLSEKLIVNPKNKGIANILVTLSLSRNESPPQPHPDYEKTAQGEVEIDNRCCRFEPHVCLIRTGQTLVIKNSDPIGHNTNVNLQNNLAFNESIEAGGTLKKSVFKKRESGMIPISCGSHGWMTAWLIVQDHPYFQVSDEEGHLTIKKIPTGKWEFQFRHPDSVYLQGLRVAGKKIGKRGKIDLRIESGMNDLGVVKVPEGSLQ